LINSSPVSTYVDEAGRRGKSIPIIREGGAHTHTSNDEFTKMDDLTREEAPFRRTTTKSSSITEPHHFGGVGTVTQ
jgi:hypothetical protein